MFDASSPTAAAWPARTSTSEHLLLTAERLFAEQGIAAVSLRQIAVAAGQRNPAVVQYHFGSKEQLIRAIIEFRVAGINEHRLALLAQGRRRGRAELRRLMRAIVVPLHQHSAGTHYVRFLAHLSATPRALDEAFGAIDTSAGLSGRLVADALQHELRELPAEISSFRSAMVLRLILGTIAVRHEEVAAGLHDGLGDQMFVDDLVEAAVGLLGAPLRPGSSQDGPGK
jgi:AcrR family transcriptional regulator